MQRVALCRFICASLLAAMLTACGGTGDEYDGFDNSVNLNTPNRFLTFFNRQGDLPAGDYTLVVGTKGNNVSGSFSIILTRNDGSSTELINGSWSDSGTQNTTNPFSTCATGNRCYDINMQDSTGIMIELSSAADGAIYLVNNNNTSEVVASADANGAGGDEELDFTESDIDETDYARAYYDVVDPGDARTTAQDFIALHGLDTPDEHVIFRDSKDLGYGRDMYMVSYPNTECGGQVIAFFVRNFSVKIVDGFAYGPVNLEAAIEEDLTHHFGSNAIEWSRGLDSSAGDTCSPEPMAKFYTYRADYSSPGAVHPRLDRVDLDARGAKAMPQPCVSCHGGKLRPLDSNGNFTHAHAEDATNQLGDTKARLQAFEVDTFEFSEESGYTRAELEEGLRKMNLAVYCTYPESDASGDCGDYGGGLPTEADNGEWQGDFAREMLEGWYGSDLGSVGSKYDGSFVPAGWLESGGAPAGAEELFLKVVGPNCFVCHGKRGNGLSSGSPGGKDIDFQNWQKFETHYDEIERLVFEQGRMPMGLLNYQNFWGDSAKAELLANYISSRPGFGGFNDRVRDSNGDIVIPGGRVIARAGPDRVTQPSAPITLSAEATLFADDFQWSITSQPGGAIASLSSNNSKRLSFTADTNGLYTVRLTASSSETGQSASDELTVLVDNTLSYTPRSLTFFDHIAVTGANPNNPLDTCQDCHVTANGYNVPMWWTDNQPAGHTLTLYEQFMARVNLENVEDSLVLKKPSGNHHNGGLINYTTAFFDTSDPLGDADRATYDMIVNWISEGANCGVAAAPSAAHCPDR